MMENKKLIMIKQNMITILLALVAMAGQAQDTILWQSPAIGYSDIPYFQIQKVELTKEQTALHVRMSLMPGLGFFLKSTCYLQANGKQYESIGSDSIKLDGNRIVMDDTGKKDFVLYFKPLPMDTKEFDFIDGLTEEDYQVFCIHDKDYMMPITPVPAEYLADGADEELAEMKYDATPATIHFKSINYRKGMNTRIQLGYVDLKNPAKFDDIYVRLNDDGEASFSFPIGVPQMIRLCIDNLPSTSYAFAYLAPGKDVTFLIDMLHDDTGANSKFVGIKGYFAKFDKEWYQAIIVKDGAHDSILALEKDIFGYKFVASCKDYAMSDARGFNADLARYCYYLPQALDSKPVKKPFIEDKGLSALYDKYVTEAQKTTAANKEELTTNAHYLDMTDVTPDNILQTILDRYKGKTVLIDIWATWCIPCMQGHKEMKPLKEELSDKDIVYVYLTSTTSKYDEWKKYITDISGEHYFLTKEQLDGIFQQLDKNGYPTYAVFSPNGEEVTTFTGLRDVKIIREALVKTAFEVQRTHN
jgi:thiol-disulfide isomerase/thioredoxin